MKAELDNVQTIIQNWLIENPSIEGLYDDISEFGTRTTNPNLSSMPLWAFQAFGGTQGRKIEIKHITRNNSCLLQPNKIGYDIEILFTIYDTFGNGKNDAKKWWFPGLVSLWVLQHYRNFDCGDKAPCYIPITNHEIQILHKISVCADVP